jgi:hypothetical protein
MNFVDKLIENDINKLIKNDVNKIIKNYNITNNFRSIKEYDHVYDCSMMID